VPYLIADIDSAEVSNKSSSLLKFKLYLFYILVLTHNLSVSMALKKADSLQLSSILCAYLNRGAGADYVVPGNKFIGDTISARGFAVLD
jgi:hypothetical protein